MMVGAGAVADLQRTERRRVRAAVLVAVALATLLGLAAAAVSANRTYVGIGLVAALALPFIWWRAPAAGVVTLLGSATAVEQFQYSVGIPGLDAFTDRLPVFASFDSALGVRGLVMSPMDIAVVLLLLVWLTRGVTERRLRLPRTQVAAGVAVMLLLACLALLRGLTGGAPGEGGQSAASASLWELRPWLYLGAAYLFSSQVVRSRGALCALLWTLVLGTGFKAVQGVYILLRTRDEVPRPEAILAHEESFFFALFAILTLSLWIFGLRGRLRLAATALLPLVIVADLGNDRRDGVLCMGAALIVLLVLAYVARPARRRTIRRAAMAGIMALAVYLPLEWNGAGTLATVADAIRSGVAPAPRDAQSNQYRIDEDADLGAMIRQAPIIGTGFGVPIQYNLTPVSTINASATFVDYVPHNTLLYVWVRMGPLGEVTVWLLAAAGLLAGVRASRSDDAQHAVLGALAASATVAWMVMGYTDMGFWWFRIAIAFGVILGMLHASAEAALPPGGTGVRQRPPPP